jgi:hypothetical protein
LIVWATHIKLRRGYLALAQRTSNHEARRRYAHRDRGHRAGGIVCQEFHSQNKEV